MDRLGRAWDLDRYAEMVARTTTREAMTQGTLSRLREYGITLAQVSAHNAQDFCIYYEHAVVNIGDEPHPAARSPEATAVAAEGLAIYPPISAINGGPPFHPRCVHVLTPFVERLATEEEKKRGIVSHDLLNKSPAELQRRFRKQYPDIACRAARRYQGRGQAGRLRGERTDRQSRQAKRARQRTNTSGQQSPATRR